MGEQEILKPVFATYPPYNILNALPSGAIQEVKGDITLFGTWVGMADHFFVILPYNNKNTTIKRYISFNLAVDVNWNKVIELILDKWKDNKLSSEEIEKEDISKLLLKIGAATLNGTDMFINNEYQMNYNAANPTSPIGSIDITDTANPRSQKKEEK